MSGHFCKLDKIAAAAAADIKGNLFNGSSTTSSQLTSMISTHSATLSADSTGVAHENRFLASLASMASASNGLVAGSCLTGGATVASRSRSNSITNNGSHMHLFNSKPSEDLLASTAAAAAPSLPSSSSSCFMNKFSLSASSSAFVEKHNLWPLNGILRNQNLNCPGESKLCSPLIPPKSLPLAPSTSTQTCTAASVASALSSALAPLFIEPSEVISKIKNNVIILLDCRTWSEFNTTHIKDSVHLNCRDKITRKRLQTRKVTVKDLISCEEVKSKLESNEAKANSAAAQPLDQDESSSSSTESSIADECPAAAPLQRSSSQCNQLLAEAASNSSNMIVLYDDTTSELEDLQSEANPLKIVQENIKQCGYKKECKILKGGFKEFSKHWPSLCVLKEKSEKLLNAVFCDAQQDLGQSAIENAVMNEIMPHLFLGNEMDAKDEKKLEENGIYYILNVTKNIPFYTSPSNSKFVHKRIAVNDCVSQNLKQHFDEAIQFIDEAKRNNSKVLVHCQAGVSRSPTIVIAYLMHTLRLSMNDALAKVRQIRPIIAPNLIFMSQLSDFETRVFSEKQQTHVDENAAASRAELAAAQNQNVNTKSLLLLAETNDQKIVEKIASDKVDVVVEEEEHDDLYADPIDFHFDEFSSADDDADDRQSCMNDMGHHKRPSHHNANEVLVCN